MAVSCETKRQRGSKTTSIYLEYNGWLSNMEWVRWQLERSTSTQSRSIIENTFFVLV